MLPQKGNLLPRFPPSNPEASAQASREIYQDNHDSRRAKIMLKRARLYTVLVLCIDPSSHVAKAVEIAKKKERQ
jgi:hypothetical protein